MKRILAVCLCLAMIACVPTVQQKETQQAVTPEPTESSAVPAPVRFPVTDATAPLPDAVESVNLADHLLIYESDGATYLYAYGESVFLHHGEPYLCYSPYNYLTEGTALTFIEPSDGTLRIMDLNDPHKAPVTVDPENVNGVKRFAVSQRGDILFLKNEDGKIDGKPSEALYLYRNGKAKRIEESVGSIDQFSLSLDGSSLVFYLEDPYLDYLVMDGGNPIRINDYIEDISEDFQSVLVGEGKTLTLYRNGTEPIPLSENYKPLAYFIEPDGTIRWGEHDLSYWEFNGVKKVKLLENAEFPHFTESGMLEFFRDGSLYVQFGDDLPLLICEKEPGKNVFLSNILDGGKRIVYGTRTDYREDPDAFMHQTTYVVDVDRHGVSEPMLISDDNYTVIPFRDDFIVVKTADTIACDLCFKDQLLGKNVQFWSETRFFIDAARENLFFICEGHLYHFDGSSLKMIMETDPPLDSFPFDYLENGTFLYADGEDIYYYDGTAFHLILKHIGSHRFASFLGDALDERLLHD